MHQTYASLRVRVEKHNRTEWSATVTPLERSAIALALQEECAVAIESNETTRAEGRARPRAVKWLARDVRKINEIIRNLRVLQRKVVYPPSEADDVLAVDLSP